MTESSFGSKTLLTIGLSLLVVFTFLGNSSVLLVLLCRARRLLRKPLYVFICNICLSDVFATLFTMTFEVYEEITHEWWFGGEPSCKVVEYLEMTLFGVNIFTHLSIAIERFRNVVQPLKPPMKLKIAKILVGVSWGVPSVLSLPYLYTLRLTETSEGKFICTSVTMPLIWLDKLFLSVELLVVFLIPLLGTAVLYTMVIRKLYKRKKQADVVLPQATQTTMRAAAKYGSRVSIAVATVFVTCWIPFVVVYIARLFSSSDSVNRTSTLYVFALYSSFVSELLTPLLYCAFDRNIKPALRDTLRCRSRISVPSEESVSEVSAPRGGGTQVQRSEVASRVARTSRIGMA
ncbi:neuropeptide S receptor-like [Dendronephthya gigantea]|uniref:neuropeptide S receptor-like n=1 Tax=Dendronephthya gigantea TaxID=151771 RepID=UPI00106ADFC4|nr:neuropeptide S receptor-like [Dendronephthya gigantea]